MAGKYNYREYNGKSRADDDVLASRGHAEKLRRDLKAAGHDAKVEASGKSDNPEHRVWIQHPKHKDTCAYVNREEAPRLVEGDWEPQWIRK